MTRDRRLQTRVLSSVSSRNSRFPEKNNAWTQVTDFANIKDRRLTLLLQMVLFILNYNANNKAILLDKNVSWIIVKYEYNFEKFGIAIPTILLSNTSAWLPACLSLSIWLPFPERYGCSHFTELVVIVSLLHFGKFWLLAGTSTYSRDSLRVDMRAMFRDKSRNALKSDHFNWVV